MIIHNKDIIRLKLYLKYLISKRTSIYSNLNDDKQKIVVALAADYGNLGDVAITFAQTEFLKKIYPEAEIIDFPISKTFSHLKSLKRVIKPHDIITIVGGGNTGDLYDDIEYCRQFIIRNFPKNRIICFPQTIDFSKTEYGKKSLKRAIKVYGKHKYLTLSAREEKSFSIFKELFPNNKVFFVPDIVLSLDETLPTLQRSGITFCFRSDDEKCLEIEKERELIRKISEKNLIRFQDTLITKDMMTPEEREKEFRNILSIFKSSEVVITDRLHGMLFCAITNTPCLAFDNSTRKISGVYDAWLRKFDFIRLIKSTENVDFNQDLDYLKSCSLINVRVPKLSHFFELFTQ